MEANKTIDQIRFGMTPKIALPIMGFLLVVSNLFTRQITVIEENREDIIENAEAGRRRLANGLEIMKLENEIIRLKDKLENATK